MKLEKTPEGVNCVSEFNVIKRDFLIMNSLFEKKIFCYIRDLTLTTDLFLLFCHLFFRILFSQTIPCSIKKNSRRIHGTLIISVEKIFHFPLDSFQSKIKTHKLSIIIFRFLLFFTIMKKFKDYGFSILYSKNYLNL